MKQRFIHKNPQARYIRPLRPKATIVLAIEKKEDVNEVITEENNNSDMTKAEEIAAMVAEKPTVKKNVKKQTKKTDGLIERVDVTYLTEDNKTLLND